ncbi:hypothetical protein ACO4GX_004458, partial [Yersinia enterocolitica]
MDCLQVTGKASTKRHSDSVDLYDETLLGSQLNARGDITLQAVQDITLNASSVQTYGALKLAAGAASPELMVPAIIAAMGW